MRISTCFSRLAILAATAFAGFPAAAQMVSGNVFLQGNFVEVGVANNGAFGSTVNAPTGYHPRPGGSQTVYNPATGTNSTLNSLLGFVSDPGKDGWTVGTPAMMGDYFMPGTPQEGWKIQIGTGAEGIAYFPNFNMFGSTGYTGTGGLTGANTGYTSAGGAVTGTWEGTMGSLAIRQETKVPADKLYFIIKVTIKNTGATMIPDIYYTRTLDPDNDVTLPPFSYVTKNTIAAQLPNPEGHTLVSAEGQAVNGFPYLGLGTKDCRAKCWIVTSGLSPSGTSAQLYNQTAPSTVYAQGSVITNDVGIGLSFHLEDLAPGDSLIFSYAYILNANDLDEALNATSSFLTVDNMPFTSGDTVSVEAGCGVCDTVTLGAIGAPGTEWEWFPNTGLLDTVGDSIKAVICGPMTYYAIGMGPCGADTLTVHFEPAGITVDPPTVVSPISYCQGEIATQLTATGWPLQWWTTPTGGTPLPTAPTPNTSIPGTYTWYVSTSEGTCESVRVPIDVIIKPRPLTPVLTANPVPLCSGNTLTLTASTDQPAATWQISGPEGFTSTNAMSTIDAVTTLHSGIYTAIATLDGCASPPGTVEVTVNQTPAMPTVTYNDPVCDSTTLELHAVTDVSPVTYVWSGPNDFVSSVGNPTIPMAVLGTHDGVYVVTAYSEGGCVSEAGSVNVVINPIPAPPVTDSVTYCQFTPAEPLTAIGSNLTWYIAATGKDTFLAAPTPQTDTPGVTVFYVSQTQATCESRRAPLVVSIEPMPLATISANRDSICAGTQVHFSLDINTTPSALTWDFGDGAILSGMESVDHSYEAEGNYIASLNLSFGVCPDTSVKTLVTVLKIPRIDIGRDTAMCPASGPIVLMDYMNASDGNATWLWNTGETTNSILAKQPGVYWSTVTVGTCSATDSVEVRKDCYMDMPNIFTPNGDGLNDYFFPRQELTSSLAAFKMVIFNRWGEKVFETSSINGRGWDGKYNGKDQPQGVYIYQVTAVFLDGRIENLNGNVTLLR